MAKRKRCSAKNAKGLRCSYFEAIDGKCRYHQEPTGGERRGRSGRRNGRPHECTTRVIDAVCQAVNVGATWKDAAAFAGKSESVLQHWKNRGQRALLEAGFSPEDEGGVPGLETRGDDPKDQRLYMPEVLRETVEPAELAFVEFLLRTARARSSGRVSMLAVLHAAAPGDWRAAAKRLAIANEVYAEKQNVPQSKIDSAVEEQLRKVLRAVQSETSKEQYVRIANALAGGPRGTD